jgi:methyl-accepting chemotaxis protein
MVLEYGIAGTTDELVTSFGLLVRDIEEEKSIFEFNIKKEKIESVFSELDPAISYGESVVIYSRLKNSVAFLNEYFDRGIENIQKKNFTQMSEIVEQIERARQNIRDTTTALVLSELNFSKQQQTELDAMERLIWIFGMILIAVTTAGALVTAFILSKKISRPLARLSRLAEDISGGNLSLSVENDLLGRGDEIGSLSESLAVMLEILKRKIHEAETSLEATKKLECALEKEKESVELKVVELERMNRLMVGRELKMAELKKDIETLKGKKDEL